MGETQETGLIRSAPKITNSWWRVLLIGLLFYFLSLVALVLTSNPVLFPTVVMVGSFMIPVTYVAFFYDRRRLSRLTVPAIAQGFIYGASSACWRPPCWSRFSFGNWTLLPPLE